MVTVPLEEQLYELGGTSEGSVSGEEDPAVVQLLAARVKEVIHKQVQGSSLQAPHLAGSVLDKCTAWTGLAGVGGGDGLPAQSDPIDCTILHLLTPLLHWVLGMVEVGDKLMRQTHVGVWKVYRYGSNTQRYIECCYWSQHKGQAGQRGGKYSSTSTWPKSQVSPHTHTQTSDTTPSQTLTLIPYQPQQQHIICLCALAIIPATARTG